jgi:hypothetical protein
VASVSTTQRANIALYARKAITETQRITESVICVNVARKPSFAIRKQAVAFVIRKALLAANVINAIGRDTLADRIRPMAHAFTT